LALENLAKVPRARLWFAPTPLEPQFNLAKELGVESFLIKRDDCNGLAFGGNKVRQMEYYLGEAIANNCDTLLITGAVQSNFVRTAAAGCAKYALQCHVQLENRVSKDTENYRASGNVLLNHLLGAVIHSYSEGEDEEGADRNLEAIADKLRGEGRNPYVVHLHPSHPPLGALGYIDAAEEILEQLQGLPEQPDIIFAPSGSGSTHGGLLYGLRALGCEIPVHGICVRRDAQLQQVRIEERLQQIAGYLGETSAATNSDVIINDQYLAPGYGVAGSEAQAAIRLLARTEALILDPVYTAKTMAAALAYARENPKSRVLFLHTGGGPSIFGYGDQQF